MKKNPQRVAAERVEEMQEKTQMKQKPKKANMGKKHKMTALTQEAGMSRPKKSTY